MVILGPPISWSSLTSDGSFGPHGILINPHFETKKDDFRQKKMRKVAHHVGAFHGILMSCELGLVVWEALPGLQLLCSLLDALSETYPLQAHAPRKWGTVGWENP